MRTLVIAAIAALMAPPAQAQNGADVYGKWQTESTNAHVELCIPVPNPTYWTPKGHITPVQVTHTELKAIGGAILDKTNAHYQQYFTHKAVIMNAVDYAAMVMLYDYSTGYDL